MVKRAAQLKVDPKTELNLLFWHVYKTLQFIILRPLHEVILTLKTYNPVISAKAESILLIAKSA